MNKIEQLQLEYRLYFAIAYNITGRWLCESHTRHYVFYATSDEEAWKICMAKINSASEEVNPQTLFRFRDNRSLEKVPERPGSDGHGGYPRRRPEEITEDPHRELRAFCMSELNELLDLPVTKVRTRKMARIEIK